MTATIEVHTDEQSRLWREHARGDHRERDRGPQDACLHCVRP